MSEHDVLRLLLVEEDRFRVKNLLDAVARDRDLFLLAAVVKREHWLVYGYLTSGCAFIRPALDARLQAGVHVETLRRAVVSQCMDGHNVIDHVLNKGDTLAFGSLCGFFGAVIVMRMMGGDVLGNDMTMLNSWLRMLTKDKGLMHSPEHRLELAEFVEERLSACIATVETFVEKEIHELRTIIWEMQMAGVGVRLPASVLGQVVRRCGRCKSCYKSFCGVHDDLVEMAVEGCVGELPLYVDELVEYGPAIVDAMVFENNPRTICSPVLFRIYGDENIGLFFEHVTARQDWFVRLGGHKCENMLNCIGFDYAWLSGFVEHTIHRRFDCMEELLYHMSFAKLPHRIELIQKVLAHVAYAFAWCCVDATWSRSYSRDKCAHDIESFLETVVVSHGTWVPHRDPPLCTLEAGVLHHITSSCEEEAYPLIHRAYAVLSVH